MNVLSTELLRSKIRKTRDSLDANQIPIPKKKTSADTVTNYGQSTACQQYQLKPENLWILNWLLLWMCGC